MNEILTAKEVAAELRCSRAQVYKLINGEVPGIHKLPAIPLGKKKKVVMRSSLEAWKRTIEIARINDRNNPDLEMNAVDAVN
jgi:predicted DNA-binding transcriptional regulator AlpA